ncbi:MAG: T9SS type A sorting domain-containing protein [bacterium]|nr:T9SS type A sorting domain-containing protein [bacterium]
MLSKAKSASGGKKILFSLVSAGILFTANVHAAVSISDTLWTRTFGGTSSEVGNSVQQTSDGGFVIAGTTKSFGAGVEDVYLVRTNSSGDTLWTKAFGGTSSDYGNSVQQTQDGGFIIAGTTKSFGIGAPTYSNVYLIKTNSSGDTLWTRTFGDFSNEDGYSVQSISGGTNGFIIAGSTTSFGAGGGDIYLVRTNSSGDTIWTRTYGGSNNDWGAYVQKTQDGGFIITGGASSFGAGSYDAYLVRTDSLGDTLWTRAFGGTSYDYGKSVQQTQDGGFIITGETSSFGTGTPGYYNVYLIKTNSSGDTLWTRTFGGTKDDYGNSVQQAQDGGFIIAGQTQSFGIATPTYFNVYIIKTNSSGNALWTKTFGGIYSDVGNSVQSVSDADSGFIIAGTTGTFGETSGDVYLIRLSKEVGVEEKLNIKNQISKLEISQNPFSRSTIISYSVWNSRDCSINLYDISGKCIKTITNEPKPAGTYSINLNANELKTGIYFLQLNANGTKITKKITIIK